MPLKDAMEEQRDTAWEALLWKWKKYSCNVEEMV